MRYLYGDSAPFPHGYDFLATLQRFLEESARTVSLTSEMASLVEARVASERTRVRALADLEALHATLVADLEAGAMRLAGELAPDYAGRIRDEAGRAVEAARAHAAQREDHERRALETELAQRHELARQALEGFFLSARMPILAATIRMDLEGQSPRMSAELVHEGGIVAAVTLAASRAHDWVAPRRAGDFAPELSMLIGLKKGLFRRGDEPEAVRLDDFILGGFVLGEDTAEIRLRRRATEPDAYVFEARLQEEGRLVAHVTRALEAAEHAGPVELEEADRRKVLQFWERLRSAVEGPLDQRSALTALMLDGENVFDSGQYGELLARVVRSLAHTMTEVSRRSPNKEELSLKRESDAGAREELYVKKKDLLVALAGLTLEQRTLFAPLGLGVAE